MRSAIDFTDANYQKIKQLRLKNEEQYQPKIIYYKMELTLQNAAILLLDTKQGTKKVMLPLEIAFFMTVQNPIKDIPYSKGSNL
jgi:hypothetical protein